MVLQIGKNRTKDQDNSEEGLMLVRCAISTTGSAVAQNLFAGDEGAKSTSKGFSDG